MVRVPFSVENDWFSDQCEVLTYELDELVGTKSVTSSTFTLRSLRGQVW